MPAGEEGVIKQPTAGIVLAAGSSSRMGRTKQLLELGGQTLLIHVLTVALSSELAAVVLVLGHDETKVKRSLGNLIDHKGLHVVINRNYQAGMAGSLQTGLREVKDRFPSVMFLLGDQPFIDSKSINLLLHCFWKSKKNICVPVQGSRRGNPVCFSKFLYDPIFNLTGDIGAREIIDGHAEDILRVEIDSPLFFMDIDNADDLKRLGNMPSTRITS